MIQWYHGYNYSLCFHGGVHMVGSTLSDRWNVLWAVRTAALIVLCVSSDSYISDWCVELYLTRHIPVTWNSERLSMYKLLLLRPLWICGLSSSSLSTCITPFTKMAAICGEKKKHWISVYVQHIQYKIQQRFRSLQSSSGEAVQCSWRSLSSSC